MINHYKNFKRQTQFILFAFFGLTSLQSFSQCFTATVTPRNTGCFGSCDGSSKVTTSGGSGSFIYSWSAVGSTSANIFSLCTGSYSVLITDAVNTTCTSTQSFTISEPPALSLITTSVNSTCGLSNGSVNATASGGTGTINYQWSTGVTSQTVSNLAAATYTVSIIDANDCAKTQTVTLINVGTNPQSTFTNTMVSCNGVCNGSSVVNATGGTGTYLYSWSTGATSKTAINLCPSTYTVTVIEASSGCSSTASNLITEPSSISAPTFTTKAATCGLNNGTISVSASGGTGAFTYSWSSSASGATITNLAGGTYTVTVEDANLCTKTSITSIVSIPPPMLSTSVTSPILCFGSTGNAQASVTGGTPDYTFNWSNGANATTSIANNQQFLSSGTYSVTLTDANGCTAFSTVLLTQPNQLFVNATSTSTSSCATSTGTATATATGGTGSLTYTWSNIAVGQTINNLQTGCYTVTVVDNNGCTATSTTCVTSPNSMTLSTMITPATCGSNNGTIVVTVTGGTPQFIYVWSSGATGKTNSNLSAACYTVTVSDNTNCTVTTVACITSTSPPTLTTTVTPATCGSSNGMIVVNLTGGTSPFTYSWSNGPTIATNNNLQAGNYTVTVTDVNNCSSTTSAIVNCVTGITETTNALSFNVSPNPTHGSFMLESRFEKNEKALIYLTNILGETVLLVDNIQPNGIYKKVVNVDHLLGGIYFLVVQQNNERAVKKVVIQ